MKRNVPRDGFDAQGGEASIPGTWVMGNVRARHRDGLYIVRCVEMRQPRAMGKCYKIELLFAIVGGPYANADVARADVPRLADPAMPVSGRSRADVSSFYNVQRIGKVWRIGARSKLYEVVSLVLGDREPPRDADPAMLLAGRAFVAEIVSVERDWRKQPLPLHHRYSKIARLIEHVPQLDECPDEDLPPF